MHRLRDWRPVIADAVEEFLKCGDAAKVWPASVPIDDFAQALRAHAGARRWIVSSFGRLAHGQPILA